MTDAFHWGPANPHPLSKMHTELVWDGKYDEYGRRREVDVAALDMPMQRIETVDEPRQRAEAQGQLAMFDKQLAGQKQDDFRNRLIWGDNKLVMASLLKEFKGAVDLIYIDPPFDVGADFTMDVPIGDGKETVEKDQSTLEMVAYRDMWGKGTDSYLHMMYERLTLMRELLSDKGSIYVHTDWRVNSYVRFLLDEIFGRKCMVNEVIWCYRDRANRKEHWNQKHDTLYWYSKNEGRFTFNIDAVRVPYRPEYIEKFKYEDENGHYYIRGRNIKGSPVRLKDGLTPEVEARHPDLTFRQYLEEGSPPLDWWEIPILNKAANERTGYATQKPEALVERIVKGSSGEGDLVADFFCGSGTTGAVAERLGRRWLMSDLGRFGIHTSRKRLIDLQRTLHAEGKPYRAFDVYNLGRYERQWWQQDRLKGADEEHRRVVLEFFKAEVLTHAPSPLLHGRKAGAFCHVDGIDGLFTRQEARAVAEAVAQAGGREVYCLAWEFEMELRQACLALEAEFGVRFKLIPIPREIMEKNRTSPPPFLEMAVLEAEPVVRTDRGARQVDVKLTRFMPTLAEVPGKELEALKERAISSGFDFIDFWAVDFEWAPNQPFNHNWQDYRTRKDRSLRTVSEARHAYASPGKHQICVKVVDVFGCDTSIVVEVEV